MHAAPRAASVWPSDSRDFRSFPGVSGPSESRRFDRLSGPSRFEAVMAVRPCARTARFMVHHLPLPLPMPAPIDQVDPVASGMVLPVDKSDGHAIAPAVDNSVEKSVDESVEKVVENLFVPGQSTSLRLGLVVPKRHARRAVTRTLVKNQLRDAMRRHLPHLAPGDWVLRLRAPIDRARFPSARSEALAAELRGEIDRLLADAMRRTARHCAAPSS
nr:ribonuclease P protein component [Sphaerotilus sulfidivorans]